MSLEFSYRVPILFNILFQNNLKLRYEKKERKKEKRKKERKKKKEKERKKPKHMEILIIFHIL